ncbi:hypothetical protein KCU85_g2897, partial [Aureobasidium melanogenum]
MQQHQGTPIHGSKQQATPKFGSQQQGPWKPQSNQVETPNDEPEPKKKKRNSSNLQKQQENHQTAQDETKANPNNQLVLSEQPKDQVLDLSGQLMELLQARLDSGLEKLWKKFEDHQSRKCCMHCKEDSKLGFVVMREQHEQLTEDVKEEFTTVKEEFTTVKKEQTLINIKVDTYKASVIPLKKQFKEHETMLKNLLADVKELHNDFEEQYEDGVNLVSRWIREEREKRREEMDETRKELAGHDRQLVRMQNEVAEYVEKNTEARDQVIRFREQLVQVAEDCAGHDQQLAEHGQKLAGHKDRHNVHDNRYNSHEERLTGLDGKLLGHGERLAEHNEQFLGLHDRLSAYDDKSAGHDQKFNELNAWKLEIEKRVTEVEEQGNERKEQYDNLKAQYCEQQELVKRLNDRLDDLHNKLADAHEARNKASEENQAYVDFIAQERIRTIRLEQKVEHVLEEQKKMKQDHQEYQARVKSMLFEKSRTDLVAFKAQATKVEALESQTGTLTSLVEQLQTHLAQLTHLSRQPVQASDLEARVQTLEQQTVQHSGLKDWQARMELYFHGSRDTMFTWARGELKEHQSNIDSQIESIKAQSDCQEKDVKMMKQRLEDQDLKFLTLRALALSKTNQLSTQDAFPSCEKVIEGQPEDDATWNSSHILMMADEDLNQQEGEDTVPQTLTEPDAGLSEEDFTRQAENEDIEQSRLDVSPVLYDPGREISRGPSPAIEETAQSPSSPLSPMRSSIVDEAEDSTKSDQDYVMPDVSVQENNSQPDQGRVNESDEDGNNPVHAHSRTRKDGWSETEIEIVQNTMAETENRDSSMTERYRLCQQRLSEKGFRRTFTSCGQLWIKRLIPADRRKARHWSERELEILRDTMRELKDQDMIMRERFQLCERRLREKGFERASKACQNLWYGKYDFDSKGKNSTWSNWSKKELEILQNTMKELAGNYRPQNGCYRICQKRLEENGFKRLPQACKQRYQNFKAEKDKAEKDKAEKEGAEEEYVWTEDQIHLLGKAFEATIGAYGQLNSDQRFKRISEMLNKTGEMTVSVTRETCMEQWYRMPAEERCKIEEMIPIPRGASSTICPGQESMPLAVGNSSLAEDNSAEHTEQASYLLGHLASDYDSGPSQALQKHNSLHVDQSALFNAEREAGEASVTQVSACQETATSIPSTGTPPRLPTIEVTKILPQSCMIEQSPDVDRTAQVTAEEAMDEHCMSEDPHDLIAVAATAESVGEQHEVDNVPEAIHDEPTKPSNRTLQNSFPASAATANAMPANFKCYEWMQMNFEPNPAVQGHTADQMALDKSPAMSVAQPSNDEEEPSGDTIAADFADAVADEIAKLCEETTTGWSHMDIGFWIADSD